MSSELFSLSRVDFVTVGTTGPPGQRTFYLQAEQGDLVVSLIIKKEHAAALSLGIRQLLEELGGVPEQELIPTDLELRQPLQPLFRIGSLDLGYNSQEDALAIIARVQMKEGKEAPKVHLWCSRVQMVALAERAAEVVMAGRPRCPLCGEPLEQGKRHVCARSNGGQQPLRANE